MAEPSEAARRHWSGTFWLTIFILVLWFIFSFGVHWYAKQLNELEFMGFPLGYYLAVQGSLAIFVILIFVQNWIQDAIDSSAGFDSDERT